MFRAHVLIIRRSKLHYTTSGIITPLGGRPVRRLREEKKATFWTVACCSLVRFTSQFHTENGERIFLLNAYKHRQKTR